MSVLGRRGFTLVELLIAITILGIVATGIYKVLNNSQRTFAAQTQRIDLQQNIRAAANILPAELREVDAGEGDITAMDSTGITIRAMRALAIICSAPALPVAVGGNITFTVRQQPFFGGRQSFQSGDSVLIYWEGNPGTRNDDQWIAGQIMAAPTSPNCPDVPTPKPGYQIVVRPTWTGTATNTATAITNGAPVRRFETVRYQLYHSPSDNLYYLAQTANASTQPLVGPLSGSNGLGFTYYDSTGTVTTGTRTQVALVSLKLRARTTQMIRQANDPAPAYKYDSITVRVALRNNPRCGPGAIPPRTCN